MRKKTIYIPIEIKAREFTAQTLLACKIAERGGRVYLGGKSALLRAVKTKPNLGGTLLYKSGWPGGGFLDLKHRVSRIAVLDQEMSPAWPSLRPSRRFEDEELDTIDRFYYVGEGFADSLLADRPGLEKSKVKALGWPRVDLWNPRYSSFWEPESQKIRKRFGDFVLFSSDFGVLHAEDVPWRLERLKNSRDLSTHVLGDPKKAELYLLEKVTEFGAVVAFLNSLDKDPEFPTVVVRPHPAEDHSRWLEALRGMKKTLLVYEGDVSVWLQASTALLHRGCTTGLQAALAGKPAGFLAFAAAASPWGRSVSRELSKSIRSVADAFDLLEEGGLRPPAIERNLIANTAGSSSEMISDDLLSLTTELEDRMPTFRQSPGRQREMFLRVRRKARAMFHSQHRPSDHFLATPRAVTQQNLKGGISAAEVRRVLRRLNARNIAVRQVARNLVCIEAEIKLNRQII